VTYPILYRISACLLALGALGHTLGGMLGTARRGPQAGPEADEVMARMKAVRFTWRGADSTWYAWWMGNGLGVSALLVLPIVVLWCLGGDGAARRIPLPIAWSAFASVALLSGFGFKYFGKRIGSVFGLIAVLTGIAAALSTLAGSAPSAS
jgi:hypothetical protein